MNHWKPDTPSAWAGFKPIGPQRNEAVPTVCRCQEVLLTRIRRRDWEQIIRALCVAGVPHSAIAKHLGVWKSTVVNWQHGGEPKESNARKVLALYRRHVGEI